MPDFSGADADFFVPRPRPRNLSREPYNIVICGIGGTGVTSIGAILGTAAQNAREQLKGTFILLRIAEIEGIKREAGIERESRTAVLFVVILGWMGVAYAGLVICEMKLRFLPSAPARRWRVPDGRLSMTRFRIAL